MTLGRKVNLSKERDLTNCLWLTKKSLTQSSTREANRWGLELLPLVGSSADKRMTLQLIKSIQHTTKHISLITNYETLNTNLNDLFQFNWDVFVVDEVHKLKGGGRFNPPELWKNLDTLQKKYPNAFKQYLSGTPYQNAPQDMFAYLALFDPDKFVEPYGSHSEAIRNFLNIFASRNFLQKYDLNQQSLFKILSDNIIRRRKDEVGIQLPSKSYREHIIELDKSSELGKIHKEIYDNFLLSLPEDEDTALSIGSMFGYLHYLRTVLLAPGSFKFNHYPVDPITLERSETPVIIRREFKPPYPKLDYAFELACEIMDEGEQVVITSSQYNTPLEYLKNLFTELGHTVEQISGATSSKASQIEERFQQGETKILLLNAKAAAEGLNLQRSDMWPGGASQMIKLDEWWNPGVNLQVEDRLWRTGTKYPVLIHRLFVDHSVDQLIQEILEEKQALADEIMESENLRPRQWKDRLNKIFGE